MERTNKTFRVVLPAVLVALTAAMTMAVRVPTPATRGYVNVGDTAIFVAALLFGPRMGGIAGGLGSALADLLGGYALWAPMTLVIKGLEGVVVGLLFGGRKLNSRKGFFVGVLVCLVGGGVMVFGYWTAEVVLFGWAAALTEVPGNVAQALTSLVLALPVAIALERAGMRRGY